ncbi:hypothetical protein GCM10010505_07520 [Kitasatospora aburaviensis]
MFEESSDVGVELVRLGKDRSFLSWKVGGAASLVIGLGVLPREVVDGWAVECYGSVQSRAC